SALSSFHARAHHWPTVSRSRSPGGTGAVTVPKKTPSKKRRSSQGTAETTRLAREGGGTMRRPPDRPILGRLHRRQPARPGVAGLPGLVPGELTLRHVRPMVTHPLPAFLCY